MRKIGAHVSAAGGPHRAVERAKDIGCNCVQVFSGSPRVWRRKPIEQIDFDAAASAVETTGVSPIVTHSLYLINLASEDPDLVRKSRDVLVYDMQFDAAIGGGGIVVHLGSHQRRGWDAVKDAVVRLVSEIIEASPPEAHFLIENSAGQSGKLSSDLAEIRWLLDTVAAPNLKWCFDTCHAHAAGYALGAPGSNPARNDPDASAPTEVRYAIDEIDRLELWDDLTCIHVNDSRDPFDSGRDRHDNIGEGLIPPDDMAHFLNIPQVLDLPCFLEVPGLDGDGPDAENVRRLAAIVGAS